MTEHKTESDHGRKGWSKATVARPIDADEYLRRVQQEDEFNVVRAAERALGPTWDELGRCHICGHWRTEHCNADGFAYCDDHYPEGLR